ncbi:unnamed protein product [Discula destructiva]
MYQYLNSLTKYLSLFAALVSVTLGEYSDFGNGAYGPWNIPRPIFNQLTSKPNATGTILFHGPSSGDSAFNLQLNVTADVPLTDAANASTDLGIDPSQYTTASTFSLDGSSDESICISLWSGLAENITANATGLCTQDGSGCSRFLSEMCIQDIISYLKTYDENCSTKSVVYPIPHSCAGQFAHTLSGETSKFNTSNPNFLNVASEPHAEGDRAAWSSASTNIWPIFFTFVSKSSGFNTQELGVTNTTAYLQCIRVDTFLNTTSDSAVSPTTSTTSGGSAGTPAATTTASTATTNFGHGPRIISFILMVYGVLFVYASF